MHNSNRVLRMYQQQFEGRFPANETVIEGPTFGSLAVLPISELEEILNRLDEEELPGFIYRVYEQLHGISEHEEFCDQASQLDANVVSITEYFK